MTTENSAQDPFEGMINQAAEAARAAKAPRKRQPRVTYTGKVRDALASNPDISQPELIRKVIAAMGIQCSGLDAMADDELLQVVAVGRRVVDLRKDLEKAAAKK